MRRSIDGNTVNFKVDMENIKKLLDEYACITKKIVNWTSDYSNIGNPIYNFTTENIKGEFAELLVCEKLDLIQQLASNKNYDATDDNGKKYQIKSRWLGHRNHSGKTEMGQIKCETLKQIDYVICLLFNSDFSVKNAFKMSSKSFINHSLSIHKNNARKLYLNQKRITKLLNDDSVIDLTNILNGTMLINQS